MTDRADAGEIVRILAKAYPDAPPTYLDFSNPFEMLIATILSAHTSDACVNTITKPLFRQYPTPKALASASQDDVIEIIRPCGTYNRKSEYLIRTAKELVDRFDDGVPDTIEDLVTLPGVSRKTANVVLSVAFATNEGVVVDTHVMRVTLRLGLSKHEKKPDKIEKDLMEALPKNLWGEYARLVGAHGRQRCKARNPACPSCPLKRICPSAQL
jgi:endonuclease-3